MRIALCAKQVRRSYSGKEEYDINRVSRFESETIDVTFAVNSPQAPPTIADCWYKVPLPPRLLGDLSIIHIRGSCQAKLPASVNLKKS